MGAASRCQALSDSVTITLKLTATCGNSQRQQLHVPARSVVVLDFVGWKARRWFCGNRWPDLWHPWAPGAVAARWPAVR